MQRIRTDPVTGVVVEDPQIRDFASVLVELDKGRVHLEASEGLWDLIQAVEQVKKKGTFTLTLVVAPVNDAEGSPLDVRAEVKVSPPRPAPRANVAYVDEQGNLTRNDPRQPEIEGLRVIDTDNKNVRSI